MKMRLRRTIEHMLLALAFCVPVHVLANNPNFDPIDFVSTTQSGADSPPGSPIRTTLAPIVPLESVLAPDVGCPVTCGETVTGNFTSDDRFRETEEEEICGLSEYMDTRIYTFVVDPDGINHGRFYFDPCGSDIELEFSLYWHGSDGDAEKSSVRLLDVQSCDSIVDDNDVAKNDLLITAPLHPGPYTLTVSGKPEQIGNFQFDVRCVDPPSLAFDAQLAVDSYIIKLANMVDINVKQISTNFSSFQKSWDGLTLVPTTQLLYGTPGIANSVLVIDPNTSSIDEVTVTNLSVTDFDKYTGRFAYVPETDLLYAAPGGESKVLIFNPQTNESALIDDQFFIEFDSLGPKYTNFVYVEQMRLLYATPLVLDNVLVFDPLSNSSERVFMEGIFMEGMGEARLHWGFAAYSPVTMWLYAPPNGVDSILAFDPSTNSPYPGLVETPARQRWAEFVHDSGTLKLFAPPVAGDTLLVFDPATNATGTISLKTFGAFQGILLHQSGNILCIPFNGESSVVMLFPESNITETASIRYKGNTHLVAGAFSEATDLIYTITDDGKNMFSIAPAVDPCAVNATCARRCHSECAWNDRYDLCLTARDGQRTSELALENDHGLGCPAFQLSEICYYQAQNIARKAENKEIVAGRTTEIIGFEDECILRSTAFLHPFGDDFSEISFKFEIDVEDEADLDNMHWCTKAGGNTTLFNPTVGEWQAKLIVEDDGDQEITIASFKLVVVNNTDFQISDSCIEDVEDLIERALTTEFYVNESTIVNGLYDCDREHAFIGGTNPNRAVLRLDIEDADGHKFDGYKFLDGEDATMLIRPSKLTNHSAILMSVDGNGDELVLLNFTLLPLQRADAFSAKNGPKGRGCVHGTVVDTVKFDGKFECDCSGTSFDGENCDQTSQSDLPYIIGAILAGALLLALIGFFTRRYYRARATARHVKHLAYNSAGLSAHEQDLTDALFDALEYGPRLDTAAFRLLDRGAHAYARSPTTHRLPQSIVLARASPGEKLAHKLFQLHCEIDSSIGALIANPEKFEFLMSVLEKLASMHWRNKANQTVLHRVVDACRLSLSAHLYTISALHRHHAISADLATVMSRTLLSIDSSMLTEEDSRGMKPGDLAVRCDDALELEKLLSVVVYSNFQLVRPTEQLYRSPTALVMACKDLSWNGRVLLESSRDTGSAQERSLDSALSLQSDPELVLKMMTDHESWRREIESRSVLAVCRDAVIPILSIASSDPAVEKEVGGFPVVEARQNNKSEFLHDVSVDLMKRYPYALAMERADRNLLEVISNERLAAEPLALIRIAAKKIGQCIQELHAAGVIHGDIKPRNIVRTDANLYKCIDFDMAFAPGGSARELPNKWAESDKVKATSAYTAPELLQTAVGGKSTLKANMEDSVRLDIWSFGVTVYEMVTGIPMLQHSYDRATDTAVERLLNWNGISKADEKQLHDLHGSQDATSLIDFLQWCLDADPLNRPSSMEAVLDHGFLEPASGSLREHFAVQKIKELLAQNPGVPRPCDVSIMISYCWADTQFVLSKLALALAPMVRDMWLDRLGGSHGMGEWTQESMEAGVGGADIIIAIVSPAYVKSKNCGFEMKLAAEKRKTIIPIKLGIPFSEWPPKMVGTQTMDGGQFADQVSGDLKLFIDFEDVGQFETKLQQELKPRLTRRGEEAGFGSGAIKKSPQSGSNVRSVQSSPEYLDIADGEPQVDEQVFGFQL